MSAFRLPALAGAALLALLLPGCAPVNEAQPSASTASGSAASATCDPTTLATLTAGTLTVGTDQPAYEPWFADNTPDNGQGFESAVTYAVAEQLGYDRSEVTWTTASFTSVVQPGVKPFDFAVNQFSITDERKQAVDFSTGYYDVTQAVVTVQGSKAAGVSDLAGLKPLKIGAQVGTTSYQAITEVIAPTSDPAVFDDNDKAKLALANGQIDALVVDLPTALYLAAADLEDGVVVGQLAASTTAEVEQFGLVLSKGSPLTGCVSQAVDALRADGTLSTLQRTWLAESAGAPLLK